MRMLVISPQPFFTPRGTPFSVYYRALVMAEQGVEIDLLTYGAGEDVDIPGVRIVRIPRVRFLEPIPVAPVVPKRMDMPDLRPSYSRQNRVRCAVSLAAQKTDFAKRTHFSLEPQENTGG